MTIIGFDPGRDKCGLAVAKANNPSDVLYHQVIASDQAMKTIDQLIGEYTPHTLVMGNLTTSKQWKKKLTQHLSTSSAIDIHLVNEQNSTVEARSRYWQMYPPQGLDFNRFLPLGLRTPPKPVDDIVAIILIERYFQKKAEV